MPVEIARTILSKIDAILIHAGAGMSVDSGIPDYRGREGRWTLMPDHKKVLNHHGFAKQSAKTIRYYKDFIKHCKAAQPHPGYFSLLEYAQKLPGGYFVLTSNIDRMFVRSGFDEKRVNECFGTIDHYQCTIPCHDFYFLDGDINALNKNCPICGNAIRPNVSMFADEWFVLKRTEEKDKNLSNWLNRIRSKRLAILEIGAGTEVNYIRRNSSVISEALGAPILRLNLYEPGIPTNGVAIQQSAEQGLSNLMRHVL